MVFLKQLANNQQFGNWRQLWLASSQISWELQWIYQNWFSDSWEAWFKCVRTWSHWEFSENWDSKIFKNCQLSVPQKFLELPNTGIERRWRLGKTRWWDVEDADGRDQDDEDDGGGDEDGNGEDGEGEEGGDDEDDGECEEGGEGGDAEDDGEGEEDGEDGDGGDVGEALEF